MVNTQNHGMQWPDFSIDNEAWNRAKAELPNATLSDIAQRAQQIKQEISQHETNSASN